MIDQSQITIRKATREDAIPATELLKRLGLILPEGEGINRFWDRLWVDNPYYEYFEEERLYGWAMEHNDRMVGFFGCIPRVYLLDGQPQRVAIASQWGVEKDYREFTHMLCQAFFQDNPIDVKLVTTAIKPTGRIFDRYDGKPVPCPGLGQVIMVPLRLKKLLGGRFPRFKPIARAVGSTIPHSYRFRKIKEDSSFKEFNLSQIPPEVNSFLEHHSKNRKGLFALRNSETLNWLFSDNFRGLTTHAYAQYSNGDVTGYAAMVDEPVSDMPEIRRFKVVDLLAGSAEIRSSMFKQLAGIAFDNDADVMEIHLPGTVNKTDVPFPTLSRDLPQFPVYYQSTNPDLSARLNSPDAWHISPFDGDSCLV